MSDDRDMVVATQPSVGVGMASADQFGHIEARVRADAQVRATLALARPRDLDVVRERLLRDARRPGFAAVAQYSVPRAGKQITGPSIRFAEAVLRALGNIAVDVTILHETDEQRAGEVALVDLESNQVYRQGFVVAKTVERRRLPPGARQEDIVRTRVSAEGQTLYILRASDADVLQAQGAITSRIIRTLALRMAPGDIVDEALAACEATRRAGDSADPDAARKRVADAFASLGVGVADLKAYLGHPLEQSSPAELDGLRGLYAAIRDGQTTWAEVAAPAQPEDPAAKARETALRAAKKEVAHE